MSDKNKQKSPVTAISHTSSLVDKQELILNINKNPDIRYPIRILEAYLSLCEGYWSDNADGSNPGSVLCQMMNEAQDKRKEILQKAITILERELK